MAEKSIGALWQKEGKSGTYFSGTIEIDGKKFGIVVFANGYKKEPKQPDWRIFFARAKEQQPNRIENEQPEY